MIDYREYIGLLAKMVTHKVELSLLEIHQIRDFENAQPLGCPYCTRPMRSSFEPTRIMHDVAACEQIAKSQFEKVMQFQIKSRQ